MAVAGNAPPRVVVRQVTASPEEFAHGLRCAFPEAVEGGPERFRATYRGTVMEIELARSAPRVIGRLALPVLAVTLRFPSAGVDERAAMLARLDLATHRGGG
ncbi:MAG: hypothetical protein IPG28_19660 [Betaproteobacteria bacterium]|nr:hypothetical protein [Betaproteobacteria bacterium]